MTDNEDVNKFNNFKIENNEERTASNEKINEDSEKLREIKEWIYDIEEKGTTEQLFYIITELMEEDYKEFIKVVNLIFNTLKEKSVEKANEFLHEVFAYRRSKLERQKMKEKINKKFRKSLKEELKSSFTEKKNIVSYIVMFVIATIFIIIGLSQNPLLVVLEALAFILPMILGLILIFIVVRAISKSISSSYLFPRTIKQNSLIRTLQLTGLFAINFWLMYLTILQDFIFDLEIWVVTLTIIFGFLFSFAVLIISSLHRKEFEAFLLDWHSFFIKYEYLSSLLEPTLIKNLSKRAQDTEYSKTIFQILKRIAGLIEYKLYPDLKVQIKHEDSHRILLSIIRDETIVVYQFVKTIKLLNLARFNEFYGSFHELIQLIRSEDVANPSDAFMFKHKIKLVAKIKHFLSKNMGKILVGTLTGIIVYILTKNLM